MALRQSFFARWFKVYFFLALFAFAVLVVLINLPQVLAMGETEAPNPDWSDVHHECRTAPLPDYHRPAH